MFNEPIEIESGKWLLTMEDAGDGSGDGVLILPDPVIESLGWVEGDELNIEVLDDGRIEIRKKD